MRRPWLRRLVLAAAILVFGLPALGTLAYGLLPPPVTPLMLIRLIDGESLNKDWVALSRIDPDLQRAVLAAEDARFCLHHGFDWQAIDNAIDRLDRGGRLLGASTVSMQTAKNLFLWPGRTLLRKGVEAWLTLWLETFWSKRRILEVYLNIIEWGPGVYGAEAAARYWYGKSASALTRSEAAHLAAILPNPRRFKAVGGSRYVEGRAQTIQARLDQVPYTFGEICP